ELCSLLHQPVDHDGGFQARLMTACTRISEFYTRRRQLFRMMQAEDARQACAKEQARETRQQWHARRQQLVDALASILADGVASGDLRDDRSPQALALMLLGLMRARVADAGH